jgi:ADP-heptose:LPS heptosyltransferase
MTTIAWAPVAPEADVSRIGVVRANALGDFVFALPALDALRATYPAAEIVLLAQPWHADFLRHRPSPVDRVVVIPGPVRVGPELEAFFTAMRQERFDIALQLHGGGRESNPFTRRLGARLTVGLRSPEAEPLDRCIPYRHYHPEVLRYLEVVGLAGASPVTLEPRLAVTAADVEESERVLPRDSRPLVAVHPGASDPRRRWPAERFGAVATGLARAGARVVTTGTAGEATLTARVAEAADDGVVEDLTGMLSLGGLTGPLSRCSVVVSNDTGPLHLAVAVGAPTVAIFWCGNLLNGGPFTRLRHRPAFSWRIHCPTCRADNTAWRCEHDPSFVDDVPVEEILASALDLLSG